MSRGRQPRRRARRQRRRKTAAYEREPNDGSSSFRRSRRSSRRFTRSQAGRRRRSARWPVREIAKRANSTIALSAPGAQARRTPTRLRRVYSEDVGRKFPRRFDFANPHLFTMAYVGYHAVTARPISRDAADFLSRRQPPSTHLVAKMPRGTGRVRPLDGLVAGQPAARIFKCRICRQCVDLRVTQHLRRSASRAHASASRCHAA